MNKFTRSQMGKIMAYALSAAMAVTVVPTYMMKPLVAEAATVKPTGLDATKEEVYVKSITTNTVAVAYYSTDTLSGAVNTITEDAKTVELALSIVSDGINKNIVISNDSIEAAKEKVETDVTNPTGKIYIASATSESDLLNETVADASFTPASDVKEYYTIEDSEITTAKTSADVVIKGLKNNADASLSVSDILYGTGKLYVKADAIDNAVSGLTSTGDTYSVTYTTTSGGAAKTLGTATATFNPTGIYAEDSTTAKSTFTNGEKITIDSTGLTKTGVVGLFSKTGTLKKADAK